MSYPSAEEIVAARKAASARQGAIYAANGFLFLSYVSAAMSGMIHHWFNLGDAGTFVLFLLALHIFIAQQIWRDWGKRP